MQNPQFTSQYRALPEEILNLSDTETACQYCGISYLLLTKYEKMTQQLQSLEQELQKLQVFPFTSLDSNILIRNTEMKHPS